MTDDDQRAAERRRRMAELLAQAESDVARTRAAKEEPGPVAPARRGGVLGGLLGVVILLVLAVLLIGTALTLGRFSGTPFADARRQGTATVVQCERRGPVTVKGFGFFDQCTVEIAWETGPASRVLIDDPGFFRGEKAGDTFRIGEDQGTRGRVAYSRPELPERGWITWLAWIAGLLGVLPLLAVFFYLKSVIGDAIRR